MIKLTLIVGTLIVIAVLWFFFKMIGKLIIAALVLLMAWGVIWCRTDLVVNEIEIESREIPKAFDGFRVVQISDLHVGTMLAARRELAALVEGVNGLDPDLVVVTGDLVNIRNSELTPERAEILSGLKATYGVISILGNHDVGCYIRDTTQLSPTENTRQLIQIQRDMDWTLLQDSTLRITRNGESIAVTGLSFDYGHYAFRHAKQIPVPHLERAFRGVSHDDFDITLSHVPQTWDTLLADGRSDLTLAGHVHAMQFKFRLFGRDFSPASWMYDRWSGRYDEGHQTLYINDGVGCAGIPIRVGARPEITVFTLESEQ